MRDGARIVPCDDNEVPIFPTRRAQHERKGAAVQFEAAELERLRRNYTRWYRIKNNITIFLGNFIESTAVETFIIGLVFAYAALVFVQLTIQEEISANKDVELAVNIVDMVVLVIFFIEIVIKIIVFGKVYIWDWQNMFDAVLVLLSIIMGILDLVIDEEVLSSVLSLRGVLRIMRLLVVFRRVNESQSVIHNIQRSNYGHDISSPVERVLDTLSKLAISRLLNRRDRRECQKAMKTISQGRLYDTPGLNESLCLGTAERAWLANASSGYKGQKDEDMETEDIARASLEVREKLKLSKEVEGYLASVYDWGLDIWALEDVSDNNACYIVWTRTCFLAQAFIDFIDTTLWDTFALSIQSKYRRNTYHNAVHAADVTHSSFWFLHTGELKEKARLEPIDVVSLLLAAGIHDVDHRGFNNGFMTKSKQALAIRYNDKSVMENHHIAVGFGVIQTPESAILHHLTRARFDEIRANIINMVMATDIANHFQHLGKLNTRCSSDDFLKDPTNREEKSLLLGLVLHAADISNPAKPLRSYMEWTKRVLQEYFNQGDIERNLGLLPVSMFMDRSTTNIAKCQIGFIDILVAPLYSTLGRIIPRCAKECEVILKSNKAFWETKVDIMQDHMGDQPIWLPPIPDEHEDPQYVDPTETAQFDDMEH